MNYSPTTYMKAIVGALVAGLAVVGTGLADGTLTGVEWVAVATAVVTAGGAVFLTPNKVLPMPPEVDGACGDACDCDGNIRG